MDYFRYFFGTPQRMMRTVVGLGLIIVIIRPGLLATAVEQLVAELSPLLPSVLAILIVFAGIRMILFGSSRKK